MPPPPTSPTTFLTTFLKSINLMIYHERLEKAGYITSQSINSMARSEADMEGLGILLGHRRRIQREIANCQGYPANEPLMLSTPASTSASTCTSTSMLQPFVKGQL